MSPSIRTAGALALGALIVAIAAISVRPGPAAGAPTTTDAQPAAHTITVSGTASVTRVPDVARVGVGVGITKSTVKAARNAAGQSMSRIIAALKAMGIDEKDIKTSSIDLSPQYNSNGTQIVGYRMSEQLQITVRDLDKAGDVVDTATAKGATELNGLNFDVDDPASAIDEARAAAIGQARTSAQKMAAAAGVSLGDVVSISESAVSSPGPMYYGAAIRDAAALTPVERGTQDVQATVTVIFEIAS